ncbi:hypothetical protein [Achromobacter ruhlandii]|uniref:hypothetical protein n=1 Tax=Achromobacter ruhlandii TaxID=72557 RepID=UPI0012E0F89F|nr:hypothetical protein [Achromobacter ruhlandii]
MNEERHPHARIIDSYGGPTKVAERMGILSQPGAVQRVGNWKRRGIPASVRLDHPWLNRAAPRPESRHA